MMGSTDITKEKYCMLKLLPQSQEIAEQISTIESEHPEWIQYFQEELESLGAPDAKRARVDAPPKHDSEIAVRVRALECDLVE